MGCGTEKKMPDSNSNCKEDYEQSWQNIIQIPEEVEASVAAHDSSFANKFSSSALTKIRKE